jgi:hypothetical protein
MTASNNTSPAADDEAAVGQPGPAPFQHVKEPGTLPADPAATAVVGDPPDTEHTIDAEQVEGS